MSTRRTRRILTVTAALAMAGVSALVGLPPAASALSGAGPGDVLDGQVRSGDQPLAGAAVTLWLAPSAAQALPPRRLGTATTPRDGTFRIDLTSGAGPGVFYLTADRGREARLVTVLGTTPGHRAVVNEATTVAAAYALAQFVDRQGVSGPAPGPANAAAMAADLADPHTGTVSPVLTSPPNGDQTSTLRTFDTLANALVPCAREPRECRSLIRLARQAGSPAPTDSFEAVAAIARHPADHAAEIFALAQEAPTVYRPTLGAHEAPDAWTLAIRFVGDGTTMSGPGNFAIGAAGDVWVTGNYTYSRDPRAAVCGGKQLFRFTPDGRYAPGSPYSGGGLDGAGFGITLDPSGHVWVGNFGFAADDCAAPPPHDSVSELSGDGQPLSPSATPTSGGGFTQGKVSWPQGVASDRAGNIRIANCGNDSITTYPAGDPTHASNDPATVTKPFDLALDDRGRLFVTGNGSNSVGVINADGSAARTPITGGGLDHPLGIAADTHGNMWVANSGSVTIPCPDGSIAPNPGPASVTFIDRDGTSPPRAFTGAGLTSPWGIAVDGADHVWVANFAGQRLSELCGVTTRTCPPGVRTGGAISPADGYRFDGLTRNTGVAIDPSGNVWVANNWKNVPLARQNPGGYEIVAFVGAASPLRTPLIGPPQPLLATR